MRPLTPDASPAAAPLAVDLPPYTEFLNETQWKVLMALMDAVIPAIRVQDTAQQQQGSRMQDDLSALHLSSAEYSDAASQLRNAVTPLDPTAELIEAYLAERPSDNPLFAQLMKCILSNIPPSKQRELKILLSVLSTRAGSLILTHRASPLPLLSIQDRTKILRSWATSPLWSIRALFKSMTTLGKLAWLRSTPYFAPLTGFPRVPAAWVAGSKSYPYEFLQFSPGPDVKAPVEIATDVVIVGSGCGAGVVAHKLATEFGKGLNVLVIEKGWHFDASHFPMSQTTGLANLFEAGGVIESDDGSITVTAGACFGGGGTVNWSASLQPQDFVRKEWAQERKLEFFETEDFQKCLDRVWKHMGVTGDKLTPSHGNKVLLEGAKRLGYTAKIVPQNCGDNAHHDGYCTLGCWKGEKNGPVNGWFPEAAEQGVKFVEGMKVDKVLFDVKKGKRVAVGVEGVWTPRGGAEQVKVVVKSKKVVVSCGTLWSPVVLMNSGLKNPQIGKNLYLHPTNFVMGVFDENVQPWEGGCLTSVVSDFDNLDGKGHGVKLEAMSMMPSFCLSFLPWTTGQNYKLHAAKYPHLNAFIAICRDRDTGHIYRDPVSGCPRIAYTPSDFDRAHNLRGIIELSRILFSSGAREIVPALPGLEPFVVSADKSADKTKDDFEKWIARLKQHGNRPPSTPFASAHQMGTCRMSAREKDGVVDPRGRVWGTEGLYVADASVFPSASGVNPMITVMAIAEHIARGIVEDLKGEGMQAKL